MADVQFVEGSTELLDKVDSLWKKLNKHHQTIANPFQDSFSQMTFEIRRAHWLERAKSGLLRVDIALHVGESKGQNGKCATATTVQGSVYVSSRIHSATPWSRVENEAVPSVICWVGSSISYIEETFSAQCYNDRNFGASHDQSLSLIHI